MMNGPARCRQLDLLTHVVQALEPGRIPPATRTEDAVAETADDRVRYHAGTAGRGRR
jgi:hypothetical protein